MCVRATSSCDHHQLITVVTIADDRYSKLCPPDVAEHGNRPTVYSVMPVLLLHRVSWGTLCEVIEVNDECRREVTVCHCSRASRQWRQSRSPSHVMDSIVFFSECPSVPLDSQVVRVIRS